MTKEEFWAELQRLREIPAATTRPYSCEPFDDDGAIGVEPRQPRLEKNGVEHGRLRRLD
jgi:hypothetical protein